MLGNAKKEVLYVSDDGLKYNQSLPWLKHG